MKLARLNSQTSIPIIFLLNLTLIIGLFIAITNRDFPKVGDDYRIHIPRMLDTHLHHLINGPTIQWYTPSFGGGLPAYPNPLYVQYSLPQFLIYLINPWSALMMSTVVYSTIGAISFYLFLRETLNLSSMASSLGATFIIANGFYLEHLIAGHIGYQQFPLLGLILLATFTKKLNFLQAGSIIGIALTLIINQAGFYLVIIFGLSLLICLPLLYLLQPSIYEEKKYILAFVSGIIIAFLLSMSKLSAIFSFMRFFPRELGDNYGLTYLQGLKGLAVQLTGYAARAPIFWAENQDINKITRVLQTSTGSTYGIWETDISLSPGMLLILFIFIYNFSLYILHKKIKPTRSVFAAIILTGLGVWLAIDLTLAQGPLYEFSKILPVFKSIHVNVRFASAFIFPASLLAAYGFDFSNQQRLSKGFALFLAASILTTASFVPYYFLNAQTHLRYFDLKSSMEAYHQIQDGRRLPIKRIADVSDAQVFKYNASNLGKLYEAIFGYKLENFHPEIQPGSVFKIDNGYYNMTNPASYVFPEENNLYVFERFQVDQLADLKRFVNREQPNFNISIFQHISNITSLITLISLFFYIGIQFSRLIIKAFPKKNMSPVKNDNK